MIRPKILDGKYARYICVYCGLGGARTIVAFGRAHKRCIPPKCKVYRRKPGGTAT